MVRRGGKPRGFQTGLLVFWTLDVAKLEQGFAGVGRGRTGTSPDAAGFLALGARLDKIAPRDKRPSGIQPFAIQYKSIYFHFRRIPYIEIATKHIFQYM